MRLDEGCRGRKMRSYNIKVVMRYVISPAFSGSTLGSHLENDQ